MEVPRESNERGRTATEEEGEVSGVEMDTTMTDRVAYTIWIPLSLLLKQLLPPAP